MDELVERVAGATGLDATTAQKVVALILGFLAKEGPPEDVAALSEAIPGSQAAIDEAEAEEGGGGLGSRLMGMMGSTGGLMGLAGKLTGLGLGMDQMQGAGREIFAYCKDKVGEERLGRIAGSIPGLSQFV
jgi:hypothetical protein